MQGARHDPKQSAIRPCFPVFCSGEEVYHGCADMVLAQK